MMRVEEHQERELKIGDWPVRLTSYRIGETFHCTADNISPGASLARTRGVTREEAEGKAIQYASERLQQTRRHAV
jgi:hypothetical protein